MKMPKGKIVGNTIVDYLAEFTEDDPLYWMDIADRELDRQVYGTPQASSIPPEEPSTSA